MDRVMPGVRRQIIGKHSGNSVSSPQKKSVDNRDCRRNNPSDTPHYFNCKDLVHFTENQFARSIGLLDTDQSFCFKAFPWRTSQNEELRLSWWSPLPPDNWMDVLEDDIPNVFNKFPYIGKSGAITGDSICGPIGFIVPWTHMLGQYAISREKSLDDLELRNLGTYLYTKEIMYSVLVCMKGDICDDDRFPLITCDTEAFAPLTNNFAWKVYSTMGYVNPRQTASDVFWSWDHLAFGFYCPRLLNLNIDHRLCRITEKKATKHRPRSREMTQNRATGELTADLDVITALNDKIRNVIR